MLDTLYTYKLTTVSVIDGDTIRADIDLGYGTFLKRRVIRLHGINAPESTKTIKGAPNLKLSEGIKSKEFVNSILQESDLILFKSLEKEDSFGRCLGIIYFKSRGENTIINLNELLITRGYSEKYRSK